ncbi:TIGR02206 family membrane protein [Sporolactobacillus shoreicorticis]|uniref:TIGR02206 family membrane protein n=1 Tax=Sporolactobacillus shoreicorticis TaxID=1923877 RepID=A0ABW5S380_9BACL|nr:TIGR02206 family membrane protein [Sporolactobacillus shoreicorticis]MCO7127115.1 TIGR02206 family membrane protein [Sporolactobacillus shoreicorticis]
MSEYLYPQIAGFTLFSVEHISTLLVIMTLGVCLFLFRQTLFIKKETKKFRRKRAKIAPEPRNLTRYVLAAVLLIGEAGYQIGTLIAGDWSARASLPLEVSDVSALLAALMLLTRSRRLFAILYFVGIGSAVQALVTPDLSVSFPHWHYVQFFATHGATVLACLYMIAVERTRPAYHSLWWSALWLNGYTAIMFCVNRFLDANYLYLMKKPRVSVLNWLGPWPRYLLWVEVLMLIEFHLLYWFVRRRKSWKK